MEYELGIRLDRIEQALLTILGKIETEEKHLGEKKGAKEVMADEPNYPPEEVTQETTLVKARG